MLHYNMAKDKAIFATLNECNTKKIFICDEKYLSVLGSRAIEVDNVHFIDALHVPTLSSSLLSKYQITYSGEGKTIHFSPHQVVIKDLKYHKHVLAIGIVDDIRRLYNYENFGSSYFPSILAAHSDDFNKL
jgi:hypothetical protein